MKVESFGEESTNINIHGSIPSMSFSPDHAKLKL